MILILWFLNVVMILKLQKNSFLFLFFINIWCNFVLLVVGFKDIYSWKRKLCRFGPFPILSARNGPSASFGTNFHQYHLPQSSKPSQNLISELTLIRTISKIIQTITEPKISFPYQPVSCIHISFIFNIPIKLNYKV